MENQNIDFQFKKDNPDLNKRKEIFNNLIKNYPKKIPIICERNIGSRLSAIKKTKYLIPDYYNFSQFTSIIRNNLNLNESETIFLLINGKISITGDTFIHEIYNKYKDLDGFLYINYESEMMFGN